MLTYTRLLQGVMLFNQAKLNDVKHYPPLREGVFQLFRELGTPLIREHMSAYVSIRQHTSAYRCLPALPRAGYTLNTSAYVSIRQHTSAYVSIRQHTSAYRCLPALPRAGYTLNTSLIHP
jgi:hypothetical protein